MVHLYFTCTSPVLHLYFNVAEHQNHAHDMIQTMDLSSVNGIVMGSGDGLLYEVHGTLYLLQ